MNDGSSFADRGGIDEESLGRARGCTFPRTFTFTTLSVYWRWHIRDQNTYLLVQMIITAFMRLELVDTAVPFATQITVEGFPRFSRRLRLGFVSIQILSPKSFGMIKASSAVWKSSVVERMMI